MNQEEKEMLDECVQFNRCERLVNKYLGIIRNFITEAFKRRYVYDFTHDDIKEHQNSVFLKLFENEREILRIYDESKGKTLKGWIRMIADQTVGMYLRKKDRVGYLGKNQLMPIEELTEELGIADYEKRYEARDMLKRIEDAMKKLPHRERLILLLYFDDGLSSEEIASMQNRKRNSIDQIKHRAIRHLKEILGEL